MNKIDLLHKIKELELLSKDEKSYLIDLINTHKKYGLVWEDKIEEVEEELRTKLPVLKEVKELSIINPSQKHAPNHLLIEGDNLHALTALTFTHEGKINLIYIDPPYNTGNKDFKYNDKYIDNEDSYRHSKWLSFLSKRLALAKRLLAEDAFIFISIDDNEFTQLRLLCDEIFGESNFVAAPVRRRRGSQANLAQNISTIHEYVLIYRKSPSAILNKLLSTVNEGSYKNPDNDPRGPYVTMPCTNKGGGKYTITTPTGVTHTDEWRFKIETYKKLEAENRLVFPRSGNGKPRYKLFLADKKENGVIANSWWDDVATNQEGSIELKNIFQSELKFNNPKPIGLLKRIFDLAINKPNSVVLDFFAGSGTTLNALMEHNASGNYSHQCILVTNNENGIAREVCYERNKRVIQGYQKAANHFVEGLIGNNPRYYSCEYVSRVQSLKNKIELTHLATDLLCIKENCYENVTQALSKQQSSNYNIFSDDGGNLFSIVYDDTYVEEIVAVLSDYLLINTPVKPVKVYIFANGRNSYKQEFEKIIKFVTICTIPDAIYKAFQSVLPNHATNATPELETTMIEETSKLG